MIPKRPAELVDDVLEVVFRRISIVGLDSRLVVLVDQILVIFGRAWLHLRFRTTTFTRSLRRARFDSEIGGNRRLTAAEFLATIVTAGGSFSLVVGEPTVEYCCARC